MTRAQIVTFLNARQRAWHARDAAGLAATHTDNCVIHSPMFGEVRGQAAAERSYGDLFRTFADWSYESRDLIIDGLRVAQTFTVTATHTEEFFGLEATGRKFRIDGVLIFEFEDGRISVERRLYDFTGLLLQIGVLKAKPAKT
jgi:steroid delta-isomerase-like uncharacterized protein